MLPGGAFVAGGSICRLPDWFGRICRLSALGLLALRMSASCAGFAALLFCVLVSLPFRLLCPLRCVSAWNARLADRPF